MATITVTFTNDANVSNQYVKTLTNGSLNRMINAYQNIYGVVDTNPQSNTYGQIVAVSNNQARDAMVDGVFRGWKAATKRWEQDQAAIAAANGVSDLG